MRDGGAARDDDRGSPGGATLPRVERTAHDPAVYLPGTWTVKRSLDDAELGAGRFEGTATFAPDGELIVWRESGRLQLGGFDGPARRELQVVLGHGVWEVRFADGRPFHRLELRSHAVAVEHLCGADRYLGEYRVEGPGAFTVSWRVEGPAKRQRLATRYMRP